MSLWSRLSNLSSQSVLAIFDSVVTIFKSVVTNFEFEAALRLWLHYLSLAAIFVFVVKIIESVVPIVLCVCNFYVCALLILSPKYVGKPPESILINRENKKKSGDQLDANL